VRERPKKEVDRILY